MKGQANSFKILGDIHGLFAKKPTNLEARYILHTHTK